MTKKDLTPLVIQAKSGDRNGLNQLLEECYETLFYYAYNTVKNEDLAADITQESCIEIINTIGNLRDPKAFRTWAGRIIYHKCAAYYRHSKDEVLTFEEDDLTILDRLPDESRSSLPEQIQEDKEFQQLIWQMLDALPAEQRQALMLYYLENMSVGEIAEIQGKSTGTIKSRLNYGRKAVIAQVESYEKKHGVRLHSLTLLPLLLSFLFAQNMQQTTTGAAGKLARVSQAVSGSARSTGKIPLGATGKAVKLFAGVAAGVILVGTVAGSIALSKNKSPKENIDLSETTPQTQFSQEHAQTHIHDFSKEYHILPEGHAGICQSGEEDAAQSHIYQQGVCVCGNPQPSEGLSFDKYESHCVLRGIGTCTDSQVVIPAYHQGVPVTVIGKSAFQGCESMTRVSIPETVTTIEQWAFYDCANLVSVQFAEGLTRIEDLAFIWCVSLKEIAFPNSLSYMGHSIFNECTSLRSVKLPASLTVLQRGVFSNCDSLETVFFPAGITEIGDKVFWHCTKLSQLHFDGTTAQWTAIIKGHENTWELDGTQWDTDTGAYVVICSDGQLTK